MLFFPLRQMRMNSRNFLNGASRPSRRPSPAPDAAAARGNPPRKKLPQWLLLALQLCRRFQQFHPRRLRKLFPGAVTRRFPLRTEVLKRTNQSKVSRPCFPGRHCNSNYDSVHWQAEHSCACVQVSLTACCELMGAGVASLLAHCDEACAPRGQVEEAVLRGASSAGAAAVSELLRWAH